MTTDADSTTRLRRTAMNAGVQMYCYAVIVFSLLMMLGVKEFSHLQQSESIPNIKLVAIGLMAVGLPMGLIGAAHRLRSTAKQVNP